MLDFIAQQNWFRWTWLLMLGFPLLMLLLGEVIIRLKRRNKRLVEPIAIVRNLVLPTLALALLLAQVLELGRDTIAVRLAETLLWIFIIYAVLTAVNVVVFEEAKENSWQANVPKLFLDLSRLFLVLVGLAIVMSTVWGADLGGLLAALGVGSLVIGLALQDSLGNVFSGISLLFERPIAVGDWIEVGGEVGKVEEITWRSVHVQIGSQGLLVVPNSELAKGSFKNLSRPSRIHQETFAVSFSYDDPPNTVKQILKDVITQTEGVLSDPVPWVSLTGYGDYSIGYKVGFCAESFEKAGGIRNEFATRLWYAAKRHNLTMPYPIQVAYEPQEGGNTLEGKSTEVIAALRSIPSLSPIAPALIEQIPRETAIHHYGKKEIVIREGDRLPGLYIILAGKAEVSFRDRDGNPKQIAQLSTGEFFGEKASLLSEQFSDVSVRALDDLEVMILDTTTLQRLLLQVPRFGRELGEVMELRRRTMQSANFQPIPTGLKPSAPELKSEFKPVKLRNGTSAEP
ncbi:mechanosensitive ion channel family protein [Leptolyngbya ohadii]|uniref:mechanosensitive ion channel family protein n=1 Tax=Leptolyngbya ohadii TaxID=1962290 RepID=UPI000B59DCA8|nr:mechanosensitive ion channel family protein [Leptolyngbya ohadii]